jgi:TonB family protein
MNRTTLLLAVLLAVAGCASAPYRPPEVLAAGGIEYPPAAREQKIEGYVMVAYDVNVDGTVSNARVVEAVPPGVFDEAAVAAVRTWRFHAASDHGKLVPAKDRISRVKFRLGESEDYAR